MAIDQTTLLEEQPSPDVLSLIEGLDTGEFYMPDESPYAGDWTDFGRMRRDRQRRKKFEEFDRSGGGPYAMPPEAFNLSELLPFGGFEKAVKRRDPLGVGFELASGIVPGGKAGILGLAAIRRNPEIIRNMPKSVWEKMKTPLTTGIGGNRMGLDYFSYMDPKFAIERILAPALGSLKKARKYKYTITAEGKHYFRHKETDVVKMIPSTRKEITKPQALMLPDLRIGTKAYAQRNRSVIKRRQDDLKKADLMKVRKQRLQVEDAADDLHQLGDPTVPKEVKAATLERYQQYPEAVKLEAMKILKIEGGPAGGAGAGLPAINYWKNYLEKYPLLGRPIPKRIEGAANKILIPESAADRAARVDKLYKQMDMTPVDIDKFLYQDLENIKKPKRNWKTLKTIIKTMLKKE